MRKIAAFFILLCLLMSYEFYPASDCSELPAQFASYQQAISAVKGATFKVTESVNTSSSSWIRGASYFSCDGLSGYFILKTDSQEYIHSKVPKSIWFSFKSASSFGTYYNTNIKGKYQLRLK